MTRVRLLQIFNTADFYDDDIEISQEAILTLQEWQDNPIAEWKDRLPNDAIEILNDYYPNGWWSKK